MGAGGESEWGRVVCALEFRDWERVYWGMGQTASGVSKSKKRITQSGVDFPTD